MASPSEYVLSRPTPAQTVSCVIPSFGFGCTETYTLTGTFTDDDNWSGTFSRNYVGDFVGACADCTDLTVDVDGSR